MKCVFLGIGFFVVMAGCSSSSAPNDATPTCPTSGAVPPGGYGCDLTFADNDHANMCLSPLHYEQSEIMTVMRTHGDELSLDAWEPKGAQRSMYLVVMNPKPPFVTGDRAAFHDDTARIAAVLTLSLNPTVDGMVEFEATRGSLTITKVSGTEYTLVADGLRMAAYSPDPTNVHGRGSYSASLACHVDTGN